MNELNNSMQKKIQQLKTWVNSDLKRIVGKQAVDFFRESFQNEGFINSGQKKWKDVKRRDPNSRWFGFEYKGERRGKDRKSKRKLNFSLAATTRKILTGASGELGESIEYSDTSTGVKVASDKPYAAIQNYGGEIRVFGKASAKIPARQFIGYSAELHDMIKKDIENGITRIFNQ